MFGNVNYSPGVAEVLSGALAAITPPNYSPVKRDPRKVAIGYAIRAAEAIHLNDSQIDRLVDEIERQMDVEMLDSDAVEVYERYEAYRQAERDEQERMEAESERNYRADLDAQREYNFEVEQVIERRESYASLAAG